MPSLPAPHRAGWYPSEVRPGQERYHDGHDWTEQWREVPETHGGLVIAGYACGVFLPIVGFIIGVLLLAKGRVGHGVVVCAVSLLAAGGSRSVLGVLDAAGG